MAIDGGGLPDLANVETRVLGTPSGAEEAISEWAFPFRSNCWSVSN